MKNKVNLFIVGASKCGTTTLWNMLNHHPDVFMSYPKEPKFFSSRDFHDRYADYEKLFTNVRSEKIIGEATPAYSETIILPEIPERIHSYNPNSKIIYIVREPIERLKSVWRQTLHTGHWYKPFYKDYFDIDVPVMPKNFIRAVYQYPPFIDATKYWTHLNNYRAFFEDKNILLLFFEDLKANPKSVYSNICSFLKIQPVADEAIFEKQNSSRGKKVESSWQVKLRKYKIILRLYRSISKIFNFKLKLQKEIPYEINLSLKEKENIYKELNDEILNILRYGKKNIEYWKQ